MGYVSITEKIVELLETLVPGVGPLAVVYDHHPNTIERYPAATVTALGHKNAVQTLGAGGMNRRAYQYTIRLWYRLADDDSAEIALQDATDQVLELLEAHVVEQGIWNRLMPTEAVFRPAENAEGVLVSEITVTIERIAVRNV